MTSRERVYATLRHEEPDRVPIDFGSNYNSPVAVIAYNRLKKYLGIECRTYSRGIGPMVATPDLDCYVFTTDHDIQEHVEPEMIEAIFQTALENA